jgi:hypothetical protein
VVLTVGALGVVMMGCGLLMVLRGTDDKLIEHPVLLLAGELVGFLAVIAGGVVAVRSA